MSEPAGRLCLVWWQPGPHRCCPLSAPSCWRTVPLLSHFRALAPLCPPLVSTPEWGLGALTRPTWLGVEMGAPSGILTGAPA